MKKINYLFTIIFLLVIAAGCTKDGIDDDLSYLNTISSDNFSTKIDISNDNTGKVTISPNGTGFTRYAVSYGHNDQGDTILTGTNTFYKYPEGSYTISITGYDLNGKAGATNTYPFTLIYRVPEDLQILVGSDGQIGASALYANWFMVYYGDVANEVPTRLEVGETLPPHIYPNGGPYTVRVVAESGGAANTDKTLTLFGFPITFEEPTVNYFFGTFGNASFSTVANPVPGGLNSSANVGRYEKSVGAEVWSGTYSPLNIPINFAYGNKVKMLVYNPNPANIGKLVNVELESAVAGTGGVPNGQAVIKQPFTTSGAWEELTFDYSTLPAIGPTARFGQLVMRYDDGGGTGTGQFFFVDNIRITN